MTAGNFKAAPGGTRRTRLVKETVAGTTPSSATWYFLRNRGGTGLDEDQETDQSDELSGDVIGTTDVAIVGLTGTAQYNFRLSKDTAFEVVMESLLLAAFDDVDPDKLYPANGSQPFSCEDEFTTLKESAIIRNLQTGSFSLELQAGSQVVTGSWTGRGGEREVSARQVVTGASDVDFSGQVITVGGGLPGAPTPAAGDFVKVTGTLNRQNDGYYEITDVSGNDVTVNGSFVTESGTSATLSFTGQTQFAALSGTGGVAGTSKWIRTGDDIDLELSDDDGATWYAIKNEGIRAESLNFNVTAELSDLEDITETAAFFSALQNKTIEMEMTVHVLNFEPARFQKTEREFDIRLSMLDVDGNGYRVRMPRAKTSASNFGDATQGTSQTGTWTLQGLIKPASGRDLEIERVTA